MAVFRLALDPHPQGSARSGAWGAALENGSAVTMRAKLSMLTRERPVIRTPEVSGYSKQQE